MAIPHIDKKILYIGILFLLLGCFFLLTHLQAKNPLSPLARENPPPRKVYIGLWTEGFFNNTTHAIDPSKMQQMEQKIGKNVAIANYFRGWEFLQTPEILTELSTISDNGWRPMISANPYLFTDCQARGMTLYKAIASGNCDAFLERVGQNLKKVQKPFFLRFAWEMNVASMPWSTLYTRDSPEDFVNAFRRFHDIVKKEGATNVLWVFSPQITTPTTEDIKPLYPGDAYVDWVGLDGYNWGTTQSWSKWQDFFSLFAPSYAEMTLLAPGKPLMIAEVNTSYVGGDQAKWYEDALTKQIPENFPKIQAVVFFNEDKFAQEGVKWLIDATPKSLASFRQAIQNPLYSSSF